MRVAAGVDVGSTQTKAIIMAENGAAAPVEIMARALTPTGANVRKAAENAYALACREAGLSPREIGFVVGTGYGRYNISFGQAQMTEISCHARGAQYLCPGTRTVIDMGGQDSKAISVGPNGEVLDFVMNDKCAAGTGRFLGAASYALEMSLGELGPLALKSQNPVRITTTCTVFAESEIISHLSKGILPEDVLMGVHQAITSRCVSLARRVGVHSEVTFTGGVSRNVAIVKLLEEAVGMKINVSPDAHFCGALGAALFAREHAFAPAPQAAEAIAQEAA